MQHPISQRQRNIKLWSMKCKCPLIWKYGISEYLIVLSFYLSKIMYNTFFLDLIKPLKLWENKKWGIPLSDQFIFRAKTQVSKIKANAKVKCSDKMALYSFIAFFISLKSLFYPIPWVGRIVMSWQSISQYSFIFHLMYTDNK